MDCQHRCLLWERTRREFWKAHSDEFDFVLLTDDDSMYISEGIADDYSSDYEYEVINKK